MTGQTTRPSGNEKSSWEASPALAWTVRVGIVALPILIAWASVRLLSGWFYRPDGNLGLGYWILQAVAVGALVSIVTERFTRRFVPLSALLNISLVFPDQSPSRFGTALRSGTVRQQRRHLEEIQKNGLSNSETEAAQQAIQLVTMLGHHDRLTRGHTERVRAYSELIAQEMGLPQKDRDMLAWGSMLHDIGKVMVPTEILNKEEKPDSEQWELLQAHPAEGANLLAPLASWLGPWVLAASEHHERWDGSGYPLGLSGTEISTSGRITAVADAYDVMTSRRSYKPPISAAEAREELVRCSGTQFDPNIVRAFLTVSVGKKFHLGPLAWLAELPGVANSVTAIPSAVATTGLVAGSVVVGAIATPPPPDNLAFNDEVAATILIDEPATTTTNSQPVATDSTLAPQMLIADPALTDLPQLAIPKSTSSSTSTTLVTTTQPTSTSQPPTTQSPTTPPPTTAPPTTQAPTTPPPTTEAPGGPVLSGDFLTLKQGKNRKSYVLGNDEHGGSGFDISTLEIIVAPSHARSFNVHGDHIHYKAGPDYYGADFLEYRVCNNAGVCGTARVDFTITETGGDDDDDD